MTEDDFKQQEIQRLIGSSKALEPDEKLLSEDEILRYAPKSAAASRIRLAHGKGNISDKSKVSAKPIYIISAIDFLVIFSGIILIPLNLVVLYFFLILCCLILSIIFVIYFLFIKKYSQQRTVNKTSNNVSKVEYRELPDNELFKDYKKQTSELKTKYCKKEEVVRDLIAKNFSPPSLTYKKFIAIVDNSNKVFNNQFNTIDSIITLSDNESPELKNEIEKGIDNLNLIIAKVERLTDELILNDSDSTEELNDLHDEFNDLINSIKNY